MIVELINTGSELLLGRVLNSHQEWICRRMADLGYVVSRQVAVADSGPAIETAVRESLSRADIVITTGGLGPTSDDLTRDGIAHLLGKPLREDLETLGRIEAFFARRHRPMPERTRIQALIPVGATILPNEAGTAPGLLIEVDPNPFRPGHRRSWLVMLPGPPRELQPMFVESVIPWLSQVAPVKDGFNCRTIRTVDIGESVVEEKIRERLQPLVGKGLGLGYCARVGRVDIRIEAIGADANSLLSEAEAKIRERLGAHVYGMGDDELEEVVLRFLIERKRTLALAESCTGGFIAHRLTNVPGASAAVVAGLVTYSNQAKEGFARVPVELLKDHGAVSEPVARAMAEGVREAAGTDHALAVTGIAGPAGGSAEKPVGTVFIALASPGGSRVVHRFNPWDRLTFKAVTADQALNLLRLQLVEG